MRIIKSTTLDWFFTNENGEEYVNLKEGSSYDGSKVSQLLYHSPTKDDSRNFVRVELEDGRFALEFNINNIISR